MIGTKLAHYEITSHLGSGGMGDVYQATDSKLGRSVAIKLLPEAFTHDRDRAARFEREARVLAALNHSNIAAIHGIEESGGRKFLVMELVSGETLAERIKRGAIPIDEALPIAKQIAEGLEAAHEKSIIHRDLKPANIKITPQGQVKVLDFGLAKAFAGEAADVNLSNSPTLSMAATNAGVILGTAAYMSPEQAKGKETDRTTDIWAFGCVLYEMLAGRAAFEGETLGEILGSVFKAEPDWSRLPAKTPVSIQKLLRRTLKKDPRQRLGDIRDARIEIEEAGTEAERPVTTVSARGAHFAWIVAAAAGLAAVVLAIPALRYIREVPPPLLPETRTEIVTPATTDLTSFALSPDGRQIVFTATDDDASRLWLRPLASTAAQPLAGTEGATSPFWSPDSSSIAFFADGKLKRLDIGGTPQPLAAVIAPQGGTWSADGVILFTSASGGPLFRVPASGGEAVAVTTGVGTPPYRAFPYFLPDGRHFLFRTTGTAGTAGIYLGALDAAETWRLTASDTAGVYLPSGWLVWVRAGALVGQRLDLERKALTGDPVTLADPVVFNINGAGAVSVSATGVLAYRSGANARKQLTWFDRAGKTLSVMDAPPDTVWVSISPDARRAAVHRTLVQGGNSDVWLLDGARTTRFTFDAARDRDPIWSGDGSKILFNSNRKGQFDLYQKSSSGAGNDELVLESPQDKVAIDWSSDDRFILYNSSDPQSGWDLWVLPLEGDRKPWPFLKTDFFERYGHFSPDGRWVAYASNLSGRFEIYVRPFVEPAPSGVSAARTEGQWQVSTAGGVFPRWRGDGKELYYIGSEGQMMAVPITDTGSALEPGTPLELFQTRIVGSGLDTGPIYYDVAGNDRFLITEIPDDAATAPITLLQNWKPPTN